MRANFGRVLLRPREQTRASHHNPAARPRSSRALYNPIWSTVGRIRRRRPNNGRILIPYFFSLSLYFAFIFRWSIFLSLSSHTPPLIYWLNALRMTSSRDWACAKVMTVPPWSNYPHSSSHPVGDLVYTVRLFFTFYLKGGGRPTDVNGNASTDLWIRQRQTRTEPYFSIVIVEERRANKETTS